MDNSEAGFGLLCPNCGVSIDVYASLGLSPQLCPMCRHKMIAHHSSQIYAKVTCRKCHSFFGLINNDKCPYCGELFA